MKDESPQPLSHLFKVRRWAEEVGKDRVEYRGKALHILSGDACHFRDRGGLEAFLTLKLDGPPEADIRL